MLTDAAPPPEPLLDTRALEAVLTEFAAERDWAPFHTPRNLVMALTGEVGELNEIFQWMTEAEAAQAATNPETARPVRDELADVLLYLVRLASVLGVDLDEAVRHKLVKNALKYPVATSRGSSRKSGA
jgi:NTP pyrophosphatase (non-canonical NTP hydrolase)